MTFFAASFVCIREKSLENSKLTCRGSVMVEKTNANGFKTGMDTLLSAVQATYVTELWCKMTLSFKQTILP